MSLIITNNDVELYVVEQKKAATVLYNTLKTHYESLFAGIWNNQTFTPQQILDQWDVDAGALFEVSNAIRTVLTTANDSYVPPSIPEQYEYTINQDGTVIVSAS